MPFNLMAFFVLAFALSWLWWVPLALSGAIVVPGAMPTHIPGLMGPALAAFAIALFVDGKRAVRELVQRILLVRITLIGWVAALSPVIFLVVGAILERVIRGSWPNLTGTGRYSGIPEYGVVAVLAIVLLSAFGEEIGWRGYALPRLQARFGPRIGTLILYPIWALWHLPNFWFLANFLQMDAFTILFGWGIGILAGTFVLANVAHLSRGSVFAVAVWHWTYNAASATDIGQTIPAVATIFVMIWAVSLLLHDGRRSSPSLLSVPPPTT